MEYDSHFSRAAAGMRESAIRRIGALLARRGDLVSFAPGYPSPDTFPWSHVWLPTTCPSRRARRDQRAPSET